MALSLAQAWRALKRRLGESAARRSQRIPAPLSIELLEGRTLLSGGVVLPSLNNANFVLKKAITEPDGHILEVGAAHDATKTNAAEDYDFAAARFNADGSLDASFGNDGVVVTSLSSGDDQANDVLVQPDDKIVLVGWAQNADSPGAFGLARYNPDGTLDASFGDGGEVVTNLSGEASAVALQSDGSLVVVGTAQATLPPGAPPFTVAPLAFTVARYTSDGRLDASFANGGVSQLNFASDSEDGADSVVVEAAGKLLVTGTSAHLFLEPQIIVEGPNGPIGPPPNPSYDIPVTVQYNPDGTLDDGFGTNGVVEGPPVLLESIPIPPDIPMPPPTQPTPISAPSQPEPIAAPPANPPATPVAPPTTAPIAPSSPTRTVVSPAAPVAAPSNSGDVVETPGTQQTAAPADSSSAPSPTILPILPNGATGLNLPAPTTSTGFVAAFTAAPLPLAAPVPPQANVGDPFGTLRSGGAGTYVPTDPATDPFVLPVGDGPMWEEAPPDGNLPSVPEVHGDWNLKAILDIVFATPHLGGPSGGKYAGGLEGQALPTVRAAERPPSPPVLWNEAAGSDPTNRRLAVLGSVAIGLLSGGWVGVRADAKQRRQTR